MPADHVNTAAEIVGNDLGAENFKRDAVDVVIIAMFDFTYIPSDDGRIIPANALNVAP
jgi:hypothetical protein